MKDITARRFGHLLVNHYLPTSRRWSCTCDCGRTIRVRADNLRSGNTRSCGCMRTKDEVTSRKITKGKGAPPRPYRKPSDFAVERFTNLVALSPSVTKRYAYECLCDCGTTVHIRRDNLFNGYTKSCGCRRRKFVEETRTQRIWREVNHACRNPLDRHYARVGGAGLTIAPEWHTYHNFLADMGEAPEGATFSRHDKAQGFTPANCYWKTPETVPETLDISATK